MRSRSGLLPRNSHQSSIASAITNWWSAAEATHPLKSLWQLASSTQGNPAWEGPTTPSSSSIPGPQGTTPSWAWCHPAPSCSPSAVAHLQNASPTCDTHAQLSVSSQGQPSAASSSSTSHDCCLTPAANSPHPAPSPLLHPAPLALLSRTHNTSNTCSALQRISSSAIPGSSTHTSLLFSSTSSGGGFSSTHGSSRLMATTMTKTGVPNPRPEVEQAMSTHQGGHITKRINFSNSLPELSAVVEESKSRLEPLHVTLIARKLEWLVVKQQRTPASALEVQLTARTIEQAACRRATWLNAWHIATIVRALTCLSIKMKTESLMLMAAVLTAEDCMRMRMENGPIWRDLAYGFAMQDFQNPAFWDKLCRGATGQVGTWRAQEVVSFLKHATLMVQPREEFVAAAAEMIDKKAHHFSKRDVADALYALVKLINLGQPPIVSSSRNSSSNSISSGNGNGNRNDTRRASTDIDSSTSSSNSTSNDAGSESTDIESSSGNSSRGSLDSIAGMASSGEQPPAVAGYSDSLMDMLRNQLVPKLRKAGLQEFLPLWEGKSLALFASSLVHLGAHDPETMDAISKAAFPRKTIQELQPLYVMKLTKACAGMGCSRTDLYERLVGQATANIRFSSPELRLKLLHTFKSIPGLAEHKGLQQLEKHVQVLNGAGRISS